MIFCFETNAHDTNCLRVDDALAMAQRGRRTRVEIRICSMASALAAMPRGSCIGSVGLVVPLAQHDVLGGRLAGLGRRRCPSTETGPGLSPGRRLIRGRWLTSPATVGLEYRRRAGMNAAIAFILLAGSRATDGRFRPGPCIEPKSPMLWGGGSIPFPGRRASWVSPKAHLFSSIRAYLGRYPVHRLLSHTRSKYRYPLR